MRLQTTLQMKYCFQAVQYTPYFSISVLITNRQFVRKYFPSTNEHRSYSRPDIKKQLFMEPLPQHYTVPQNIIAIESGKNPSSSLQDKLM